MLKVETIMTGYTLQGVIYDETKNTAEFGDMIDAYDAIKEIIADDFSGETIADLISFFEVIDDGGALHERIDGSISIYYHELRAWCVDNYDYIESAVAEFGAPEEFDFHKLIQLGQFVYYSKIYHEVLENMKTHIGEKYNV